MASETNAAALVRSVRERLAKAREFSAEHALSNWLAAVLAVCTPAIVFICVYAFSPYVKGLMDDCPPSQSALTKLKNSATLEQLENALESLRSESAADNPTVLRPRLTDADRKKLSNGSLTVPAVASRFADRYSEKGNPLVCRPQEFERQVKDLLRLTQAERSSALIDVPADRSAAGDRLLSAMSDAKQANKEGLARLRELSDDGTKKEQVELAMKIAADAVAAAQAELVAPIRIAAREYRARLAWASSSWLLVGLSIGCVLIAALVAMRSLMCLSPVFAGANRKITATATALLLVAASSYGASCVLSNLMRSQMDMFPSGHFGFYNVIDAYTYKHVIPGSDRLFVVGTYASQMAAVMLLVGLAACLASVMLSRKDDWSEPLRAAKRMYASQLRLQILAGVGGLLVAASILHVSVYFQWPVALLPLSAEGSPIAAVQRDLEGMASQIMLAYGLIATMFLASAVVPAILIARRQAWLLAEVAAPHKPVEELRKWLASNGLDVSVPQWLLQAFALLLPALAAILNPVQLFAPLAR